MSFSKSRCRAINLSIVTPLPIVSGEEIEGRCGVTIQNFGPNPIYLTFELNTDPLQAYVIPSNQERSFDNFNNSETLYGFTVTANQVQVIGNPPSNTRVMVWKG